MRYDIHVHMLPLSPGGVTDRPGLLLRLARYRAGDGVQDKVADLVSRSRIDRAVILALDTACTEDGQPDPRNTCLHVPDDEVADLCARHPHLLFGASVHPYRPDALEALERAAARGACLVKWIPSAQNIAPDHPRCLPFYERLADLGLPLLTHTGIEHTLGRFSDDLNHPRRLAVALERGVTVIAAHCGTRLYLYEQSQFPAWKRMALEHERLFGDTGAFGLPLHGGPMADLARDDTLRQKLLFGSDLPALVWPAWYGDRIGWRRALELAAVANPLDRLADLLLDLGLPESIFTRAGQILRLPPEAP